MNKNYTLRKRAVSHNSDTVDEGHQRKQWEVWNWRPKMQPHTGGKTDPHRYKYTHEKVPKIHTSATLTLKCEWQEKKSGRLFYLAQLKKAKSPNKRSVLLHSPLSAERLISHSSIISKMLHSSLRRGPSRKQPLLNSKRPRSLSR